VQSQYRSNFWVIFLFLASVAACEKNTEDAHAADAQAIRTAELAAVHAFNEGDIDGYMAAYPADSAWLPPKKMAYLVGAYELTLSDADGNLGTDYGKFVEVWKKHPDDSWNHVLAIWNSNDM
jgi:ketosteroid isomerase-like protein